ncbi:aminotransferase class I/II-fold pyridoxal phosphate-dependent enzyme [Oceanobacillus sp. Castelsardo]|uniref:aminotransferase class I/II-fold pyridoxal phosphate-dependent enzyme n=1 Tax=Oceanobacillus sp. Castelsardo TaxID=1851204 RepID=UPI00083803E1|nr:aminotransferase class I/II-fold pyridoxal phosphate-dependent enzyme [Oceanobacillus sp. Castelsardo]
MDQSSTPLFSLLDKFAMKHSTSFHVPGHKNGEIFLEFASSYFQQVLKLDVTELPGLDDLHAPTGAIQEAEQLAADFFKSNHTFFLVGGSTAGNLAMIMACVQSGDKVIVQRNSHKSIMHGLELSGAKPIFIAPEFDKEVGRFTSPSYETVVSAVQKHSDAKAVILTYPDYFGRTYDIKRMIESIHHYHIPVLVDEAHGVHFSLGDPFPTSSLQLGADIVVQSAHKTAPAMTQSSYLHINSAFNLKDKVAYYLQMLQSSSPSYPLMASLDIARSYLATRTDKDIEKIISSVFKVREILGRCEGLDVLPLTGKDDMLKITLHVKPSYSVQQIILGLEEFHIYPELTTDRQLLLIHGLAPFEHFIPLEKAVKRINERLKKDIIHATIDISKLFPEPISELALTYQQMNELTYTNVALDRGLGNIAAESIIPYPPGIPLILKGEKITKTQAMTVNHLLKQGVTIQQRTKGIKIYNKG